MVVKVQFQIYFFIDNKGTGPAIIEAVVIDYDGSPLQSWGDFIDKIPSADSTLSSSSYNIHKRIIKAGERYFLYKLSDGENSDSFNDSLYKYSDKITMKFCYKSVYDEHWIVTRKGFKTDLEEIITTKIDQCNIPAASMFRE